MPQKPLGVDLFAGAGGLSLGFEQAGFDVAAAVEYDPIHAATHEYNFPGCATICRSVADLDASKIMDQVGSGSEGGGVRYAGDPRLLQFKMSDAAKHYGVPITVIPQRIRKAERASAHA